MRGACFDELCVSACTAMLVSGLPRGQITELCGVPRSGIGTLALMALARAQVGGACVVVVDLPGTFDAATAIAHGVDPAALLIIRPESPSAAITAITQLCTEPDLGL